MSDFEKRWLPKRNDGGMKLGRTKEPIKVLLERAQTQLLNQIRKLDLKLSELVNKDQRLFAEAVRTIKRGNRQKAAILANEIAHLRKVVKMLTNAKIALEQINLRIGTIKELGDITVALVPAVATIKSIQTDVSRVVPEADTVFADITSNLSSILTEASQPAISVDFSPTTEDAARILEEAAAVAEMNLQSKLPDVPTSLLSEEGSEATLA
jgi:division protein CdvB (Snf7/Vps24/ESCRT-III family)